MFIHVHYLETPLSERFFDRLKEVRERLRETFRSRGGEVQEGLEPVDIVKIEFLADAITSWFAVLEAVRALLAWSAEREGPLPLQAFVLESTRPAFERDGSLPFAAELSPFLLKVARTFLMEWEQNVPADIRDSYPIVWQNNSYFSLAPSQMPPGAVLALLPSVKLFLDPEAERQCFYCGMTAHAAADCPSRHLGMEYNALDLIGNYAFPRIDFLLAKSFQAASELNDRLETGITPLDIRRDETLMAYVAFFDTNRALQHRFMRTLAESPMLKWPGSQATVPTKPEGSARFRLVMDSLRVGNLDHAMDVLEDSTQSLDVSPLFVYVCQAFIALEEDSEEAMLPYLEEALACAENEAERIYARLLLSRCLHLLGQTQEANTQVGEILKEMYDCEDGTYRRFQIYSTVERPDSFAGDLRKFFRGDPSLAVRMLADPLMVGIQPIVSGVFTLIYANLRRLAAEELNSARTTLNGLVDWLTPESAEYRSYKEKLEALEAERARYAWNEVVRVPPKAEALSDELKTVMRRCIERALGELSLAQQKILPFYAFWETYPHRTIYPGFGSGLAEMNEKIVRGQQKLQSMAVTGKKEIDALLADVGAGVAELEQMQPRMLKTKTLMAFNRNLWRSLFWMELLALAFNLILVPGLQIVLAPATLKMFGLPIQSESFVDPQILYLSCVLVAPVVALLLAFGRMFRNEP